MLIRIGTRASALALKQTELVIERLKNTNADLQFEVIKIITSGDKMYNKSLQQIGGKGLFLKEIEDELLQGNIDIAVHSMKDAPAELPQGLVIPSMIAREDHRDAFISERYNNLDELPKGAVVGTSSTRRRAQLLNLRPDLKIVEFRGNVNTRLAKLSSGEVDATMLAVAGLKRLGMLEKAKYIFSHEEFLPAIGQGAIGVECRADDYAMHSVLAQINHEHTFACVTIERSFLQAMSADCTTPLAAYAEINGDAALLRAKYYKPSDLQEISIQKVAPVIYARMLGKQCAEEILGKI